MRECWQDYRYAGGSNPQPGNRYGIVLSPLVAHLCDVLLRMQVKLQNMTLDVAGSTPVGPCKRP